MSSDIEELKSLEELKLVHRQSTDLIEGLKANIQSKLQSNLLA